MNNNDIYDEEKRIKEEEKLHEIACEVQFNEDMENFNKTNAIKFTIGITISLLTSEEKMSKDQLKA